MGSHEPSGPPAGFSGCTLDVDQSVNTGPVHFERVASFKSKQGAPGVGAAGGGGGTISLWDPEAQGWVEGAAALELNHVKFKSWRPQCPSGAQARGCSPRTEQPFQACGRGARGPGWHLVGGTLLALEQLQPQSRSGPRSQGRQPQAGRDGLTLQTAGRWAWMEEVGRARGCRYRAQAMGGCGLSLGRGLKVAKGSAMQ